MSESLSIEVNVKPETDPRDLEQIVIARRTLEAIFNVFPERVEEVETNSDLSVRRIRSYVPDVDGGYVESHLIGVAEVQSSERKSFVLEAFYPYSDRRSRHFYELDSSTDNLIILSDVDCSALDKDSYWQRVIFPHLCNDVFARVEYKYDKVAKKINEFPFKHPYFQ